LLSPITQALAFEYCSRGYLGHPSAQDHRQLPPERDALENAQRHLPLEEIRWVKPEGGFFYWIEMPRIDVRALFEKAIEKKVAFVMGMPFFPNGGGEHNARLNYTYSSPEIIDEGVRRLGEAMRELLAR
jgi:2-aminoadipate transaminase